MSNFLLIGDALRRNAYKYPVKVAAKDAWRQLTYHELNDRVNRLANGLLNIGIKKGDAIALLVGNRIEHLEILFALAKIGALAIPLDVKWRSLEIHSTLASLQPVALFLEQNCLKELTEAKKTKGLDEIKTLTIDSKGFNKLFEGLNEEPKVEGGGGHRSPGPSVGRGAKGCGGS